MVWKQVESVSLLQSHLLFIFCLFGFIISPPVFLLFPYFRCMFFSEGLEDQCALLLEVLGKIK